MPIGLASTQARHAADLRFVAAVALRFDTPLPIGETADGVRFEFWVEGSVSGPELNGRVPRCAAYLLIDSDGVGTINVRAPLLLDDGAVADLEAMGRYDFGQYGYRKAAELRLPNSALGWCPRLLTGDPRHDWLNRMLFLGVGELRPGETRVDYDLFAISPEATAVGVVSLRSEQRVGPRHTSRYGSRPLYERLGGAEKIYDFMAAFVDGLHTNEALHRQNPRILAGLRHHDELELKRKFGAFVCELAGGPREYRGRTMKQAHSHLSLSEADWELGARELISALEEYRVHPADQQDLLMLISKTKAEIVQH